MSPYNDVGGKDGFGPIAREEGEPPFHHAWESRVFALNRLLLKQGLYDLDEFRYAVERLPEDVRQRGYYEKWLSAIEMLLKEKGKLP